MPIQPSTAAGAGLAIATAVFWAISPMCFASAGRRIGSFPVVVIRIILAVMLLLALLPVYRMLARPPLIWPNLRQIGWLVASALSGMVIGDVLYYEALVRLGPRRSSQMQVLAPVASVAVAWITLGEHLPVHSLAGIALVLVATSYAVLGGGKARPDVPRDPGHVTFIGLLLGASAALFTGLGAVLGREAFRVDNPMDPFLATIVRVGATAVILSAVPLVRGRLGAMFANLRDPGLLVRIIGGTLAGPFFGMLTYIASLQRLEAGLVSTLASMSPVFILPMIALRYRARIGLKVIAATLLAAGGVGLICVR